MEFDHSSVDFVDFLLEVGDLADGFGESEFGHHFSRGLEVEVGIDPLFFECGDEVVDFVELDGVDFDVGAAGFPDGSSVEVPSVVEMVEPDDVDAEFGHTGGDYVGVLFEGECSSGPDVGAEEPDSSSGF